jgi:hypothetical protein
MADTTYNGIFGVGFSMMYTPLSGTPFGTAQAQVEEANTPPIKYDIAKFTPISGNNSNVEQFAIGRVPVQEYKMKVTYQAAEHLAALACFALKTLGTLVCTYGDGSSESYTNASLTDVQAGANTATSLRTAELTFTVPVGLSNYTFSAGTSVTTVQTTVALTAGAATIDLTAAPFSGGTKTPKTLFLLNPMSNANSITIAKGATNGYAGFGSAFSTTLVPGQSIQLDGSSALSSANKTLDLTGTGAQSLVVQAQLQ